MVVRLSKLHANVVVQYEVTEDAAGFAQKKGLIAFQVRLQDCYKVRLHNHLSVVLVHEAGSLKALEAVLLRQLVIDSGQDALQSGQELLVKHIGLLVDDGRVAEQENVQFGDVLQVRLAQSSN